MDKTKDKAHFFEALDNNSLSLMCKVPKSDLHNHVGRGGSQDYLASNKGISITPNSTPFNSLQEMQSWFENNIKKHCTGLNGYLERVKASFIQAKNDTIKVLSMSYGLDEIDILGGMDNFISIMKDYQELIPGTHFLPELVLFRHSDIDQDSKRLEAILDYNYFKSVDWQGDENSRKIEEIIPLFRIAKNHHLLLRAHVGEFGDAKCIRECVEQLELNELHHGINAIEDESLLSFLSDNKIRCHVCPTSNIMLKRSKSYKEHPIRKLFDAGIKVTINTDDLCIFNASASQEYINLYNAKVFSKDELECIRQEGLTC
jgi:adenosine deaminase